MAAPFHNKECSNKVHGVSLLSGVRRHQVFIRRAAAGPASSAPSQNVTSVTITCTPASETFSALLSGRNGTNNSKTQSISDNTISAIPVEVMPFLGRVETIGEF